MTSSETRSLKHAALLILGLGFLRLAVEAVESPVETRGVARPDSSELAALLDGSRTSRNEAQRRAAPLRDGERIDPNKAGEEELDRLPGVGPAVARRIVQLRVDRGSFVEPSDLLSVQGVGPATLARILPYLELPTSALSGEATRPWLQPRPRLRGSDGFGGQDPGPVRNPQILVDLNRASREELELLPGVGPVMSQRILELRESLGRFRRLDELRSVRGIGSATIERLRPVVVIGP